MRDTKGRFVKGHEQLNSGKTHFKKEQTPWNKGLKKETDIRVAQYSKKQSATEGTIHRDPSGYNWIKVKSSWLREHDYIWLRDSEWGFIPDGFVVHHRNEDKSDNHIDNLACIPRDIHIKLHRGVA